MKVSNCRICGQKTRFIFSHLVLNKYDVPFYVCGSCGLVQAEEPYWLKEAYSNSISCVDTGILYRNLNLAKKLTLVLFFLFGRRAKQYSYLDYGGGYGLLVRLMRDIGFDFYWYDKYTKNLFAKGFEYRGQNVKAVTAFEVFEHLPAPQRVINFALNEAGCDAIIFSTFLYKEKPPDPQDWWYYAFQTGQHVSFYNLKTLRYLAEKYKLSLLTDERKIHVLTSIKRSNPVFKFLIKFDNYLFFMVRKTLEPKTFEDHLEMINKVSSYE